MKKQVLLIVMFAMSLIMLTGCGSVTGKWHCTKLSIDGEKISNSECEDLFGLELSAYCEAEFGKDGSGTLTIRENTEKQYAFEYSEEDGEYELDFDDKAVKSGTAELEDKKLKITLKLNKKKCVFTLEEGENEKDFDLGHTKSSLRMRNSNAKLVYVSVNGTVSDLVADGKKSEIKPGKVGPIKASDLDENDPVQKAVKDAMKENDSMDGYVCWEIKEGNYRKISWAQWSDSEEGVIGQYPDPETDFKKNHTMGEKF